MELKSIQTMLNDSLYHSLVCIGEHMNDILEKAHSSPYSNYELNNIKLTFFNQDNTALSLRLVHVKFNRDKGKIIQSDLASLYLNSVAVKKINSLYNFIKNPDFALTSHTLQYYLNKNLLGNEIIFKYIENLNDNMKLLLGEEFFIQYEKDKLEKMIESKTQNEKKIKL